jgi:curved DNA-binding protein CbpA
VATAYEILSDTERRADYDYALAHPEERLYNQYRYYSQYYKKTYQVDVRVVVAGSLLIFTALQYACRITAYNTAMKQIKSTPRYQHRLKQLRAEAEAEALAKMGGRKGGKKGATSHSPSQPTTLIGDMPELENIETLNYTL